MISRGNTIVVDLYQVRREYLFPPEEDDGNDDD